MEKRIAEAKKAALAAKSDTPLSPSPLHEVEFIPPPDPSRPTIECDIEAMAALKYSIYSEYGYYDELDSVSREYLDYFNDKMTGFKNSTVKSFSDREYHNAWPSI